MSKGKKTTEQNQEREARSPVATTLPPHLAFLGEEGQAFDAKAFMEQILNNELNRFSEKQQEVARQMIRASENNNMLEVLQDLHALSNQGNINNGELTLNFQNFLNDQIGTRQEKQNQERERHAKEENSDDKSLESGDTKQVQEVNFRAYDIFELSNSDILTQLQFIQQELNKEDLSTLDKQRLIFEYELITSSHPELFQVPERRTRGEDLPAARADSKEEALKITNSVGSINPKNATEVEALINSADNEAEYIVLDYQKIKNKIAAEEVFSYGETIHHVEAQTQRVKSIVRDAFRKITQDTITSGISKIRSAARVADFFEKNKKLLDQFYPDPDAKKRIKKKIGNIKNETDVHITKYLELLLHKVQSEEESRKNDIIANILLSENSNQFQITASSLINMHENSIIPDDDFNCSNDLIEKIINESIKRISSNEDKSYFILGFTLLAQRFYSNDSDQVFVKELLKKIEDSQVLNMDKEHFKKCLESLMRNFKKTEAEVIIIEKILQNLELSEIVKFQSESNSLVSEMYEGTATINRKKLLNSLITEYIAQRQIREMHPSLNGAIDNVVKTSEDLALIRYQAQIESYLLAGKPNLELLTQIVKNEQFSDEILIKIIKSGHCEEDISRLDLQNRVKFLDLLSQIAADQNKIVDNNLFDFFIKSVADVERNSSALGELVKKRTSKLTVNSRLLDLLEKEEVENDSKLRNIETQIKQAEAEKKNAEKQSKDWQDGGGNFLITKRRLAAIEKKSQAIIELAKNINNLQDNKNELVAKNAKMQEASLKTIKALSQSAARLKQEIIAASGVEGHKAPGAKGREDIYAQIKKLLISEQQYLDAIVGNVEVSLQTLGSKFRFTQKITDAKNEDSKVAQDSQRSSNKSFNRRLASYIVANQNSSSDVNLDAVLSGALKNECLEANPDQELISILISRIKEFPALYFQGQGSVISDIISKIRRVEDLDLLRSVVISSETKQRQAGGLQIVGHLVQGSQLEDSKSKKPEINFKEFISAINERIIKITEARDRSASDSGDEKNVEGGASDLARTTSFRVPGSPSSVGQKFATNKGHKRNLTMATLGDLARSPGKMFFKNKLKINLDGVKSIESFNLSDILDQLPEVHNLNKETTKTIISHIKTAYEYMGQGEGLNRAKKEEITNSIKEIALQMKKKDSGILNNQNSELLRDLLLLNPSLKPSQKIEILQIFSPSLLLDHNKILEYLAECKTDQEKYQSLTQIFSLLEKDRGDVDKDHILSFMSYYLSENPCVASLYNLKLLKQLHNVDISLMKEGSFESFYKTLFDQLPVFQVPACIGDMASSQEGNIFHRMLKIYKIKSILKHSIQDSDTIVGSDKKLLTETLNSIDDKIRNEAINSIVIGGMNRDPADSVLRTIEIANMKKADYIHDQLLTESDKNILSVFLLGKGTLSPTITSEENISKPVTKLFIDQVVKEFSLENPLFIISAINLLTSNSISKSNYQELYDYFISEDATGQANIHSRKREDFQNELKKITSTELSDVEKTSIDTSLIVCINEIIVLLINTRERFLTDNEITTNNADNPFSFDSKFLNELTNLANQQRLSRREDSKATPVADMSSITLGSQDAKETDRPVAAENITDVAAQSQEGEILVDSKVETVTPTPSEPESASEFGANRQNRGPEAANSLNFGEFFSRSAPVPDSKVETVAETEAPGPEIEGAEVFDFNNLPGRGRSSTVSSRSNQDSGSNPRGGGGRS